MEETNSIERSPSWEADSRSALKKFLDFYGTWVFITVFIRAHSLSKMELKC
jgi:hypothetical protein